MRFLLHRLIFLLRRCVGSVTFWAAAIPNSPIRHSLLILGIDCIRRCPPRSPPSRPVVGRPSQPRTPRQKRASTASPMRCGPNSGGRGCASPFSIRLRSIRRSISTPAASSACSRSRRRRWPTDRGGTGSRPSPPVRDDGRCCGDGVSSPHGL